MKSSDPGRFIIRRIVAFHWEYATRMMKMEKLGLSGSYQSPVWSRKRSKARRFRSRSHAVSWLRDWGRFLLYAEVVELADSAHLEDRDDEVSVQRRLF